ncbi:MAG: asparagine synthase [Armatimonadota bacterium]|nr:MAG: asparagine synthase [Armatimonadota bacterium]
MAGIVGIADSGQEKWVEAALRKIEHRGGAGETIRPLDGATLGQVWPTAQERFAVDADQRATVLDGETYNWTHLSAEASSALEALETGYRERGPDFVAEVDGPFAMAIAGERGVFLARDTLGKSPLYFGESAGKLYFASELKALLDNGCDMSEFPPGHYYEPGRGLVRYSRIEKQPTLDMSNEEAATELRSRLVASVKKRLKGGEVGCWLSGGIDSATMTALATRQRRKVETFVVGVEGAPDLEYAEMVARFVESRHHERICTLDDMLEALPEVIYHLESFDALLVRSSITNFMVGKLASEHVPAVLSGEGGDELFAGYQYLKEIAPSDLPDELVDITRRLHNTALQRVDRCSSSHGLVAKTGFLDRDVVDFALQIPPSMKLYDNEIEKWILRQAMDGLLPDEVVNRTKSKFWEGAGVGELLAAHSEEAVSDAEFAAERKLPTGEVLNTKEELFYHRVFHEQFGEAVDPSLVGRTKGAPVEK